VRQKSFNSLLLSDYDWKADARLKKLTLDELTKGEMIELIRQEYRRFKPISDDSSESLIEAICRQYGSRPLSVKALFSLERIQRTLKAGPIRESDIESCPTDLESLLGEYFDQTPASVQQLVSVASLAGFEFNTTPVVEAGDELGIVNPGLSLRQSDDPYGLIDLASSSAAEFADPALHQIAERKSRDFFGRDERMAIVRRLARFAESLDLSVHSEETCRIGWTIHVELAKKGETDKSEAAKSAESLRQLHSRRHSFEQSRRYARLAVEWTAVEKRKSEEFRDLLSELANLEYVMGAESTAVKLYSDLVQIAETEQPIDRRRVLFLRHMRGVCLKELGRYEDAILELTYACVEGQKLGPSLLRDVCNSQHHVAICRRLLGQLEEAKRENAQLLENQRALLGPEHEDCIATEIEIGRCFFECGDLGKADEWFADLNHRVERVLGNHPYRWVILGEFSRTVAETRSLSQAIELCESSVSGLVKQLGARHPASLRQRKYLAAMYDSNGERDKAIAILRVVLMVQELEYGVDDERSSATRKELESLECK
jgi:tetratricopeptide (TPR) repeat protein